MISFLEFLHGDGWQKPLLPDLTKAMTRIVRSTQHANDKLRGTTTIPSHQQLMLVLARAGARGLSRAEISGLVDLESDTLNDLLDALMRSGELALSQRTDGQRVYRRLL